MVQASLLVSSSDCYLYLLLIQTKTKYQQILASGRIPQEVLEPAYTRKDLIWAPHAQGSSGRLDPSLNKYWEGNAMAIPWLGDQLERSE